MTISQLLNKGFLVLEHKSQTPDLDSEVLLSFVLHKNKAYLISHRDIEVSTSQRNLFLKLVKKRSSGLPIAYLTHTKEFYGLPFYVNEEVLIPRPETEELVDLAFNQIIEVIKGGEKALNIIDVGTGCGNIGITLIHNIIEQKLNAKTKFSFYLTDISGKALKIAKRNFKRLVKKHENIKVFFVKTDLLKGINKDFDIIISNPPYIPAKDLEYLAPGVRDFEPRVALDGGEGGLEVVKRLVSQSVDRLVEEGVLLFEIHETHPNKVKFILNGKYKGWKASFFRDSFGEWRFTKIKSKRKSQNCNAKVKNEKIQANLAGRMN